MFDSHGVTVNETRISGLGMNIVDDCLMVPVNDNTGTDILNRLAIEILSKMREEGTGKVIINVSAVKVMDTYGFSILRKAARAVELMGGKAVFVGIQAGVASSLIDLDMNLDHIHTAVTTEDALESLRVPDKQLEQYGVEIG